MAGQVEVSFVDSQRRSKTREMKRRMVAARGRKEGESARVSRSVLGCGLKVGGGGGSGGPWQREKAHAANVREEDDRGSLSTRKGAVARWAGPG
jgi:hypothetical protein